MVVVSWSVQVLLSVGPPQLVSDLLTRLQAHSCRALAAESLGNALMLKELPADLTEIHGTYKEHIPRMCRVLSAVPGIDRAAATFRRPYLRDPPLPNLVPKSAGEGFSATTPHSQRNGTFVCFLCSTCQITSSRVCIC